MSILERITNTTLIKETKYSKIFLAELDDSSKAVIKLLRNANADIYRVLASLSSLHLPKILELLENVENGETELTIVEEYIPGETVADRLHRKPFTQEEIYDLMQQLCDGVSFLHQMDPPFIHRDLKPQNLILSEKGILKIIDFNAARIYKSNAPGDTMHLGTAEYAPPEQFGYSQTDVRSDIYCLGVILYEIAYGKEFKQKNTRQILAPSGLDSIIGRCTMYDPEQRYQSVSELQADLIYYHKSNTLYKRKPRKITYLITVGTLLLASAFVMLLLWLPGTESVSATETTAVETADAAPETTAKTTASAPTTEPTSLPPVAEPTTDSVTEPITEPATEPITEPATEPITEPATEPITEPVTEPVTEPITAASAEATAPSSIAAAEAADGSAGFKIDPYADTVIFTFPQLPDSRIETIQFYDTAGNLYATIEVRHNPTSPRLLTYNTKLRINGTEYALSSSQLAKTDNGTITLTLRSADYFSTSASTFTGYSCTVSSAALPKLPAPTDLQWDPDNFGNAFWTSPYQCIQFNAKNGVVTGYNTSMRHENGYYYRSMADLIQQESATYCIMAMALGDWEHGDSDIVSTEPLVYTIPSVRLPVVTGLRFEGTTIYFDAMEGVANYHLDLYGIDKTTKKWRHAGHGRMLDTNYSNIEQWINQEIGKYDALAVKVNAVSPDPMNIAAGAPSELCIYGQ